MGGLLGKANTHKTYNAKKFEKLEFAACSMQGWRNTMEDAHIAVYPLEGEEDMGLFAVFDGHGGKIPLIQALKLPFLPSATFSNA